MFISETRNIQDLSDESVSQSVSTQKLRITPQGCRQQPRNIGPLTWRGPRAGYIVHWRGPSVLLGRHSIGSSRGAGGLQFLIIQRLGSYFLVSVVWLKKIVGDPEFE